MPRARPETDLPGDLQWLAKLLDAQFRVPGTGIRFGLDALLGLVPVAGDAATALPALYLIGRAAGVGARKRVIAGMLLNTALDSTIGAIPLVGDLFDLVFKANIRNVRLLQRELERMAARRPQD